MKQALPLSSDVQGGGEIRATYTANPGRFHVALSTHLAVAGSVVIFGTWSLNVRTGLSGGSNRGLSLPGSCSPTYACDHQAPELMRLPADRRWGEHCAGTSFSEAGPCTADHRYPRARYPASNTNVIAEGKTVAARCSIKPWCVFPNTTDDHLKFRASCVCASWPHAAAPPQAKEFAIVRKRSISEPRSGEFRFVKSAQTATHSGAWIGFSLAHFGLTNGSRSGPAADARATY